MGMLSLVLRELTLRWAQMSVRTAQQVATALNEQLHRPNAQLASIQLRRLNHVRPVLLAPIALQGLLHRHSALPVPIQPCNNHLAKLVQLALSALQAPKLRPYAQLARSVHLQQQVAQHAPRVTTVQREQRPRRCAEQVFMLLQGLQSAQSALRGIFVFRAVSHQLFVRGVAILKHKLPLVNHVQLALSVSKAL